MRSGSRSSWPAGAPRSAEDPPSVGDAATGASCACNRGMKPLSRLLLATALALTLGCDRRYDERHGGGSFDFTLFIAGTWSGTIEDSRCGTGQVSFEFFQVGDTVSGSWFILFQGRSTDGCCD